MRVTVLPSSWPPRPLLRDRDTGCCGHVRNGRDDLTVVVSMRTTLDVLKRDTHSDDHRPQSRLASRRVGWWR